MPSPAALQRIFGNEMANLLIEWMCLNCVQSLCVRRLCLAFEYANLITAAGTAYATTLCSLPPAPGKQSKSYQL